MALATSEHKRIFWSILLHIVVPRTMLSGRPAALLAALSIRLGIQPLLEVADQEMLHWKDHWNSIEIPETWNVSCMSLLMDADEAFRSRHMEKTKGLLKVEDRALFERLVSYKMVELNLDTTLMARVGWAPQKTWLPTGQVVICKSCEYPRSVTIMGEGGRCCFCLWDFSSPEERNTYVTARVKKTDNETTPMAWVECGISTCRAQYVVYRPENLNVRPKCYYCRNSLQAPTVECKECLNRVICPLEYRSNDTEDFKCYACTAGHRTIVDVETTASMLNRENGTEWLLRNDKNQIQEPFKKRSLFHTISNSGTASFCQEVELFPQAPSQSLVLCGKAIHNVPDLLTSLQNWVSRRRTESGTCSLCFSTTRKSDLLLACGRTGCSQRICQSCQHAWYGLNAAGRIINTSALSCPFCRRDPTAKTLAKYGMGIHAVAGLRTAVEESCQWIYAWCHQCGFAKRYLERVCAAGAPAELSDWSCEDCSVLKVRVKVKICPGCGTATQRTGGCCHMTCPVKGCYSHWCWYCGGKFSEKSIYGHMDSKHGAWYDGIEEGEEWEEE